MSPSSVGAGDLAGAAPDRPGRAGFIGDPGWWALGAVGLAADLALRLAVPAALAGSALRGVGPWVSCVLLQPVLEEFAFRGLLQGELLRARWGRWRLGPLSAANGSASLAFAALHFGHHPPFWAASVFLPSLVFGWLRERHRGVAAPIGMHVLYNLEFFLAASL